MLPRVDLPELLLEVDAWTGFTSEFTHVAESGTRMEDLAVSACAVLVAEGCNIGLTPVTKPGRARADQGPALARRAELRPRRHDQRGERPADRGTRPGSASPGCGAAGWWPRPTGCGSSCRCRRSTPLPNPQYFGQKNKGVTWLNAINDQVAGIGAIVVPGTMRDSLYILDTLLNLDAGPKPELVATDTASYSDIVFGLFRLLGYQFSPRIADLSDQRFWRLEAARRARPATTDRSTPWPATRSAPRGSARTGPICSGVAASLAMGTVRAYDLLRMLGRDGSPTPLGHALADYGKIAKTLHLLAMCDPDESYRRTVHVQLTIQESRHRLARKIFHGQRGELRQRYREGQEDQLGALGLVLNAVTLWNTRYTDAAVDPAPSRRAYPVDDADAARLSPLVDKHINVLGRYTFTQSAGAGLRPLRDPAASEPDDD